LAADYFAAKRLRELAEAGELIVASVSQLTYDLSVHLENSSPCPGRLHSASGFLLAHWIDHLLRRLRLSSLAQAAFLVPTMKPQS
jgi:hypothetical protein